MARITKVTRADGPCASDAVPANLVHAATDRPALDDGRRWLDMIVSAVVMASVMGALVFVVFRCYPTERSDAPPWPLFRRASWDGIRHGYDGRRTR